MYFYKKICNLLLVLPSLIVLSSCLNSQTYTVTWKDDDGNILKIDERISNGTYPNYEGQQPEKESTVEFAYVFKGWIPELSPVTENIEYVALFEEVKRTYKVSFVNYDGTALEINEFVSPGEIATYSGETPLRASSNDYDYTFTGWSPELAIVDSDITYTANFNKTKIKYELTTYLNGVEKVYQVAAGETLGFLNEVSDKYHLLMWYENDSMTLESHLGSDYLASYKMTGPLSIYGQTTFMPYDLISYGKSVMEWDRQMIYSPLNLHVKNVAVSYNLPAKVVFPLAAGSSVIVGTYSKDLYLSKNIKFELKTYGNDTPLPITISYDYKGFQVIEFKVTENEHYYLTCTYLYHDYSEYLFNITADLKN